jgi:PAS domain-containing protein
MRQWELAGITDGDLGWRPDAEAGDPSLGDPRGTFFWSTDTALRLRVVSEAAGEALGLDPWECEGRDLLAVFGMEGASLAVLEAHTEALQGGEGRFTLDRADRRVRCRVEPRHAGDGCVIGTFCLATEESPEGAAIRALTVSVA